MCYRNTKNIVSIPPGFMYTKDQISRANLGCKAEMSPRRFPSMFCEAVSTVSTYRPSP